MKDYGVKLQTTEANNHDNKIKTERKPEPRDLHQNVTVK